MWRKAKLVTAPDELPMMASSPALLRQALGPYFTRFCGLKYAVNLCKPFGVLFCVSFTLLTVPVQVKSSVLRLAAA